MKRNYLFTILLTLVGGLFSVSAWAQQRSLSQAAAIAGQLQSKTPHFTKQELTPIGGNLLSLQIGRKKSASLKPSFALQDQQPFYVFANEEEGGFVIVAGDARLGDVLGYSEDSRFDVADMPDGMADLLLFYANVYASVQSEYYAQEGARKAFSWTAVAPIVKTKWGQDYPYNAWCPESGGKRTLAGCGATAMAQIMKRWNYPTGGHGSLQYTTFTNGLNASFNYDVNTFDWDNMRNSYASNESASEVAKLIYACGVSLEMDYTPDWSSSNTLDMAYSLINIFDYADAKNCIRTYYTADEWKSMIQTELSAGRPVVYRGADANDNNGHIFVVDGVNSSGKLHVNWGWTGNCDGYFELNNLVPVENNDYRYGHWMVSKISPDEVGDREDVFYADEFRAFRAQHANGYKYVQVEMDNVWNYSNAACPRDPNTKFTGNMGAALYDLSGNFVRWFCGGEVELQSLYGYSSWYWYIYDFDSQVAEGQYILRPAVWSEETGNVTPIRTINGMTDKYYLICEDGDIQITETLPDGIHSIQNLKLKIQNEGVYDLSGRRLSAPVRGLNVVNGKRVLIK